MSLNFAANLSFMFTELPFEARFKAAARAGFRGVEFLFPYDHSPERIAELARNAGVILALHNLSPGDWDAGERGLAALDGRQSDFKTSVKQAMHYCEATGLKQLHVMAGCVADADRAAAWDIYLENLRYAVSQFAQAGITALIEPINSTDMPGYLLNHAHAAVDAIHVVGAQNLKLQFDCYHAQIMDDDALGDLCAHYGNIQHIQIASVPDRAEPDHGVCDYGAIFETLESLNYQGWIGCEYRPKGATTDGLGWFAKYSGA
jgi:hydroxypyruvate isomerase